MVMAIPEIPCYLIEWYRPELTAQSIDDIVDKLNAAATTMTSEGRPVQLSSLWRSLSTKSSTVSSPRSHRRPWSMRANEPTFQPSDSASMSAPG